MSHELKPSVRVSQDRVELPVTHLSPWRSVFPVTCATVAVGLTTLLQEVLLAAAFSTGASTDAYQFAIAVPLAAINIFAGGTLQSLLIPMLASAEHDEGRAAAARLIAWTQRALALVLFIALAVLTAVFMVGAPMVATSFSASTMDLSRRLFLNILPAFFFGSLSIAYITALNGIREHALAALLPVVTPLSAIIGLISFGESSGIAALVWGSSIGAVLQFLLARALVFRRGYGTAGAALPAGAPARIGRDYLQLVAAATLLGGILLTDIALSSTLAQGDTARFGFAARPVMLGLAFLTVIASNVALPHFSSMVATQDWKGLASSYLGWVRVLLAMSAPVSVLCYLYADEMTALIYERGAFGAAETHHVAQILGILIWQVPFYLTAMIGLRVANAMGRNLALLYIASACFVLNLTAGWLLARTHGLGGIAMATAGTFAVWAGLVTWYVGGLCRERINRAAA